MTLGPDQVWQAYNDAENARDFQTMAQLVARDLVVTVNGEPAVSSAEDDDRAMRHLTGAYPDYRRDLIEVLRSGDRAVARWRMLGTPVNGPHLDVPGCSIVTVEEGRITEAHLYYYSAALDAVLSAAIGDI